VKFQEASDEAFDRLRPERSEACLTDIGQFCAADHPNAVIVLLEVTISLAPRTTSRAKAYLAPRLTGIPTAFLAGATPEAFDPCSRNCEFRPILVNTALLPVVYNAPHRL
jgi:hypothetical protein